MAKVARKRNAKPTSKGPTFGVEALAAHVGLKPATVRMKLRMAKINAPRKGRYYDFSSKAGMEKVAGQIRA